MSKGKLLSLSVNVSKIPKGVLYEGKTGKFLNLDIWINDEEDEYGNHASANIRQSKEEREAKERKIYVGNGKKVFGWDDAPASTKATTQNMAKSAADDDGDSIPF